jgi:two-component system chemotaxis response regulator CheB
MITAHTASVSSPVKTLIVDDAPFMRKAVQAILGDSHMFDVVGTASNGLECLGRIAERRPDVITLDIDMPVMNGISAVKNIMVRHQIPIVIISSLVQDGYFAFETLRLGVMDFIPKPSKVGGMNLADQEELIRKRVLAAAGMQVNRVRRVRYKHKAAPIKTDPAACPTSAVVMGTTLAGPNTIMHLVTALPAGFNSVIIALQEIHPSILAPFCSYFNQISPIEVIPVTSTCPLLPGRVYIGSTFSNLSVETSEDGPHELEVRAIPNGEFPIDRLFSSAARHFGQRTCGVLLTGIGTDGADGMAEIKARGGLTIAQEKNCCPYPNMVENVIEKGVVDAILSNQGIISRIQAWTARG